MPTSESARSFAPAARPSSCARWSRSPSCWQARAATAEFERLRGGELRGFKVVLLHGQMRPAAKHEAMAAFAAGEARRTRRDFGDRGRDRRPERNRDARRGRRPLRDLAAAPAPRADRPRPARVAVLAVRCQGLGATAGAGRPRRRLRAGGDRSRGCAAKANWSASASMVRRSSESPSCRATPSCSSAPAGTRSVCWPTSSTRCWPSALHRRLRRRGGGADQVVRVIAGSYRGRPLVAPRGQATRPTSDRVREALFSILGSVEGSRVLDLFAGSGALAIEALSRGAAAATLVDSSPAAIAAARRNLESLGVQAETRRQDALRLPAQRTRRGPRLRSRIPGSPISPREPPRSAAR